MSVIKTENPGCHGYLSFFIVLFFAALPSGIIAFILYFSIKNTFDHSPSLMPISIISGVITWFSYLVIFELDYAMPLIIYLITFGAIGYYLVFMDALDIDPLKIRTKSIIAPLIISLILMSILYANLWSMYDSFTGFSYFVFWGTLFFAFQKVIINIWEEEPVKKKT